MTKAEFWEMKDAYEREMDEELLRVRHEAEKKGYVNAERVNFNHSKYWFEVETLNAGRYYSYFFSCKCLAELREAIEWIVNGTKFYEVTAYVEGGSYVTFRSQRDIDQMFDHYYMS